ncbi:hypothetical protein CAEBREN_03540 [Caenorhabditis brenneri]|uniref:Uncharacterized protein n=1 Tax=Caenorhabditis brenneri TaxID=135651 RepID=G0MB06_CAEBE|nr:hypothetical protein CAEBREN_03540 [Caenorhabditis brenneri]
MNNNQNARLEAQEENSQPSVDEPPIKKEPVTPGDSADDNEDDDDDVFMREAPEKENQGVESQPPEDDEEPGQSRKQVVKVEQDEEMVQDGQLKQKEADRESSNDFRSQWYQQVYIGNEYNLKADLADPGFKFFFYVDSIVNLVKKPERTRSWMTHIWNASVLAMEPSGRNLFLYERCATLLAELAKTEEHEIMRIIKSHRYVLFKMGRFNVEDLFENRRLEQNARKPRELVNRTITHMITYFQQFNMTFEDCPEGCCMYYYEGITYIRGAVEQLEAETSKRRFEVECRRRENMMLLERDQREFPFSRRHLSDPESLEYFQARLIALQKDKENQMNQSETFNQAVEQDIPDEDNDAVSLDLSS